MGGLLFVFSACCHCRCDGDGDFYATNQSTWVININFMHSILRVVLFYAISQSLVFLLAFLAHLKFVFDLPFCLLDVLSLRDMSTKPRVQCALGSVKSLLLTIVLGLLICPVPSSCQCVEITFMSMCGCLLLLYAAVSLTVRPPLFYWHTHFSLLSHFCVCPCCCCWTCLFLFFLCSLLCCPLCIVVFPQVLLDHSFFVCWISLSFLLVQFSFLMTILYPILIQPLFNKFTPLPESVLRSKIFARVTAAFPLIENIRCWRFYTFCPLECLLLWPLE